jgi:hypothetical protein
LPGYEDLPSGSWRFSGAKLKEIVNLVGVNPTLLTIWQKWEKSELGKDRDRSVFSWPDSWTRTEWRFLSPRQPLEYAPYA